MLSKLQKQKSPPGGPSPSPPPTSPDNTTAAARSERQYEILRDGSIVFFATVKDVSEATEVLAPLKATCGLLVRALEMTKSINDNKKNLLEFQRTLGIHLNFFVTYKPKDGRTHDLVERATQPYKTELEAICEEVSKEADRMKPGFTAVMKRIGRSRIDVDQQKTWNDRLNAAHKTLTTAFQITISSQLGDISQDVKAIGKDIKSISASRPANFARESLNRLFYGRDLDGCDPGTRTEVLDRIRQWATDNGASKQLLWLYGAEGVGKTSVAVTMYKEWEDKNLLGGRFFFSKDAKATSTTHEFCHVVARDLAAHVQSLQSTIEAAIKATSKGHFGLEQQLSKTIIEPLSQYEEPVFIVIDGLDAVPDPHMRHRFLVCLMKELSRAPKLKIFLSSRREVDIEEALGDPNLVEQLVELTNISNGEIHPDITLYIEKRVKSPNTDEGPQTRQSSIVASLSAGSFVWLVPAIFLLKNSRSKSELIRRINNPESPDRLTYLYHMSLAQIVHGMWPAGLKMELLSIIIAALEPMSLRTVCSFVSYKDNDIKLMLQKGFGGLVKSGDVDAPVRIRHSSFRDFCTDNTRAKEFYVDLTAAHVLMATKCFEILRPHLHYNVLNIDLPGDNPELDFPPMVLPRNEHIRDLERALKKALYPIAGSKSSPVMYASSYWPYHVAEALHDDNLVVQVVEFLSTRLLCWLELMSWRGGVHEAVDGLATLQVALDSRVSSDARLIEMKSMVSQAYSFIQSNIETIGHSALHVYCSALGLSTENSPLVQHYRTIYKDRCPVATIVQRDLPKVDPMSKGSPALLEISPNGQLVAVSNGDFSIELRQLSQLETPGRVLSGHEDRVTSLSFSHDSRLLAAGSANGQVRIWNIESGSQIHLIEQVGSISRIEFARDGSSFLVISINSRAKMSSTLRVWNLPIGGQTPSVRFTCKEPFEVATFSLDGTLVAAVTGQGVFEVRNATSGDLVSTGSTNMQPSSIIFSPDASRIAISDGLRVHLWSLTDVPSRMMEVERTRGARDHALAISSNGKYLIHGSTVWDIEIPSSPSLWSGRRLPRPLQQYNGSLLTYEDGWIYSAHPRGPLVEIPPTYDFPRGIPWRAHGSLVLFALNDRIVMVDCSPLLPS